MLIAVSLTCRRIPDVIITSSVAKTLDFKKVNLFFLRIISGFYQDVLIFLTCLLDLRRCSVEVQC